jgi:hypothetical protein
MRKVGQLRRTESILQPVSPKSTGDATRRVHRQQVCSSRPCPLPPEHRSSAGMCHRSRSSRRRAGSGYRTPRRSLPSKTGDSLRDHAHEKYRRHTTSDGMVQAVHRGSPDIKSFPTEQPLLNCRYSTRPAFARRLAGTGATRQPATFRLTHSPAPCILCQDMNLTSTRHRPRPRTRAWLLVFIGDNSSE